MKRTVPKLTGAAREVARRELIGLPVRIVAASDPGLVGLKGVVVDETLRTFTVARADGRESRIGKVGATFEFATPAGIVVVPGDAIEFRSQDRTKKVA